MKVLMLYNEFRSLRGGEDKVVSNTVALLKSRNLDVQLVTRSSKDLTFSKKIKAFFSGIYSFEASNFVRKVVRAERPDVVHVHNLYPFFSPSVLVACRAESVPVVMTVHNFALTCPHWFHFRDGQICELCSKGNVLWCVVHNCQKNTFESAGYALRAAVARQLKLFHNNVATFIALTEFARGWLISAGIDQEKIKVIPNMINVPTTPSNLEESRYVAFAGRMSPEKGVDTILSAAQLLPNVPFRLAGTGPILEDLKSRAPSNVEFMGLLGKEEIQKFYRQARMLVVPSIWYEMCPTTILEAMALGLPVICSNIGGLPEFVQSGSTGLVFNRADSAHLAEQIGVLWRDIRLCRDMGSAGRSWVKTNCSDEHHFEELRSVYLGANSEYA